jgi:hypothetical protein
MLADGAYVGEENERLAEENGYVLAATDLAGKKPDPDFAEFSIDSQSRAVVSCPSGHSPAKTSYSEKTRDLPGVFRFGAMRAMPPHGSY